MRRPGAIVGVLVFAAMVYIVLNTLRTEGPGSRGVPAGDTVPAFAVPLAGSGLDGDANVSDRACAVRGEDILNVCQLYEQGAVVLAFFIQSSERCDDQLDALDRLRERFPDVRFAAVAIKGDREALRGTIREHGWRLPVGYDRDGAVANAYGVAVCPTITLAERGGTVVRTLLGSQDEHELEAAIRELG
ncbi:MAG TPA: redoxin domain-containing protein [Solirubrobacteraceae bacterium]|nr:redoxin domain-containing protein [Solirubrobacteraceae bacterium]